MDSENIHVYEYRRVSMETAREYGKPTKGKPRNEQLEVVDQSKGPNQSYYARGGAVFCEARRGPFAALGIATCSFSDIFSAKKGRYLAYKRAEIALQALEASASQITALLDNFVSEANRLGGLEITGYSVTIGSGIVGATLTWEDRGKKAE